MISFNTQDQPFTTNYKFLIGSITPRPIAVVSTLNADKTFNLAPFSFFTAISASPMIIAFCPLIRVSNGEIKDTVRNILREKEFGLNFATENNIEKIIQTSTELKYGEDEFKFANLNPTKSSKIKAPLLAESPIQFECIFRDELNYGDHIGAGRIITGEVIKAHFSESVFDEEKNQIKSNIFRPIGRGSGTDYILCNEKKSYERKTAKID